MEERKDKTTSPETAAGTPERDTPDTRATSSETLADVEETEKVSSGGSGSGSGDGGALEGSSPRPTTEGGGRADGSDTGGPM